MLPVVVVVVVVVVVAAVVVSAGSSSAQVLPSAGSSLPSRSAGVAAATRSWWEDILKFWPLPTIRLSPSSAVKDRNKSRRSQFQDLQIVMCAVVARGRG